jgi:hypothetical protein
MIKKFTLLFICIAPLFCVAQRSGKEVSFAITNSHSAYPFSSFSKLFTGPFHPGMEAGYSFNWKTRKKHDWYQSFRIGLFHHRFVQTAIPLYTQVGYRLTRFRRVQINGALGAGYLHSISATTVLKQNNNGEYEEAKSIGRPQALVNLSFGARYSFKEGVAPSVFVAYTQQLQTPFIKSYVPLLPYNSIALGFSMPLKK